MAKIILYHGTSFSNADKIEAEGFKQAKSNWEGDVVSKKGFIYLTSAYSVYFGACASKEGDKLASIIQVEVDERDLYPDEDYIAWKFKFANPDIELEDYKRYALESLNRLGNVSIKLGSKIDIIGRKDFEVAKMWRYSDPSISPLNFPKHIATELCNHGEVLCRTESPCFSRNGTRVAQSIPVYK